MHNSDKKRVWLAICCFAVFAVTCWFLIKSMFFPNIDLGLKRLPSIAFFTIQTNLLAALWLGFIGLSELIPGLPKPKPVIGMMLCCYITVTGIVYWTMLVPMLGFAKELFALSNIWMHTVTPVVIPVVFALLPKKSEITYSGVFLLLVYPFLYTVYAYIMHALIRVYVYPFFNPNVMGSRFMVVLAVAIIGAFFVGLGFLFRYIWNRKTTEENRISEQQEA